MPVFPVPYRCIWCERSGPGVSFDKSHILPECVGNKYQQVLPLGVVCRKCNNSLSRKVEREFLREPHFRANVHILGLRNDPDLPRLPNTNTPIHWTMHTSVNDSKISVECNGPIKIQLEKEYSERNLSFLSRAIHKLGLETLAHTLYVNGHEENVDLFAESFQAVKQWVREGQPMGSVRPVIRKPAEYPAARWETEVWKFDDSFLVQMKLFSEWFAVDLMAASSKGAMHSLISRVDKNNAAGFWCIEKKPLSLETCRNRLGIQ